MYSTKGSITSTVYTSRREAPVGRRTTSAKTAFGSVQAKAPTAFDSVGRPENLPDEIAEQLRSRILNESLAAGQRLPTASLNSLRSIAKLRFCQKSKSAKFLKK